MAGVEPLQLSKWNGFWICEDTGALEILEHSPSHSTCQLGAGEGGRWGEYPGERMSALI